MRLALWRMDSSLAPLLVEESARPLAAYQAFLPADVAGRSSAKGVAQGATLDAFPLADVSRAAGAPVLRDRAGGPTHLSAGAAEALQRACPASPHRPAERIRRPRNCSGSGAHCRPRGAAGLVAAASRRRSSRFPCSIRTAAQGVAGPARQIGDQQQAARTADFNLRN